MGTNCRKRLRLLEIAVLHGSGSRKAAEAVAWFSETAQIVLGAENYFMANVFISYAREDFEVAKHLYHELIRLGQKPWLDKESLLPGQHWESAIREAVQNSDYFIAVLSPVTFRKGVIP
jgi:hypothetical protein